MKIPLDDLTKKELENDIRVLNLVVLCQSNDTPKHLNLRPLLNHLTGFLNIDKFGIIHENEKAER
jgi:hypothetical protein